MTLRWKFLSTWALLLFLGLPTARGAPIDLQTGLTGTWYEPGIGRQGFVVVVYGDSLYGQGTVLASWLTYDTIVGGAERQRWYTLSGTVVRGQTHVSMKIYQNTGGNFNAPPITALSGNEFLSYWEGPALLDASCTVGVGHILTAVPRSKP